MKIEYDKESGALYFRLCEGKPDYAEDLSEKADVSHTWTRRVTCSASKPPLSKT